jgi:hypothetical protein
MREETFPPLHPSIPRTHSFPTPLIPSTRNPSLARSTDLLALPNCDPDKAFAVQIAHEENMLTTPVAYVQCALLYTNSNGERRIRVHSLQVREGDRERGETLLSR